MARTPASGRTPHEVGITPDVVVAIAEGDRTMLELWRRRTSATPDERTKLAAWKDSVLAAAIDALRK